MQSILVFPDKTKQIQTFISGENMLVSAELKRCVM